MAQKSREEGEIGSESREKGDLPPVPPPPLISFCNGGMTRFFLFLSFQLTCDGKFLISVR